MILIKKSKKMENGVYALSNEYYSFMESLKIHFLAKTFSLRYKIKLICAWIYSKTVLYYKVKIKSRTPIYINMGDYSRVGNHFVHNKTGVKMHEDCRSAFGTAQEQNRNTSNSVEKYYKTSYSSK